MDTIIICLTVISVFSILSHIGHKFIDRLGDQKATNSAIQDLTSQIKKLSERVSATEVKGFR